MEIDANADGQRIDNFLITRLKGVPKSRVYRILRKGEVRVNKGRIRPDYRLKTGDQVRIPPIRTSPAKDGAANASEAALERIASSIIYEDKQLLVIDKPSGFAVHGGSGVSYGVIEALRALRPEADYLELVHRLDRETSGCLMIAKRRSMLRRLHALQLQNAIDKTYLTLVMGQWQHGKHKIDVPLRKNTLKSGERVVRVSEDGKPALSMFSPVTIYKSCSLMEVKIITGRTHQIRVHATHSGHPVAGDNKYGDDKFNQEMRKLGLKRLFLHAHSLAFTIEETGQQLHLSAPLPAELASVLDKIEEHE